MQLFHTKPNVTGTIQYSYTMTLVYRSMQVINFIIWTSFFISRLCLLTSYRVNTSSLAEHCAIEQAAYLAYVPPTHPLPHTQTRSKQNVPSTSLYSKSYSHPEYVPSTKPCPQILYNKHSTWYSIGKYSNKHMGKYSD